MRAVLRVVLVAVLFALLPALAEAQGCAMCRTVGQGADDPLVQGMFRSAIFMVSMPIALVLGVGGWLFHQFRRGAKAGLVVVDAPITRVIEFRRP